MDKEQLKEQLRKQQEPKSTEYVPTDSRNLGFNRIYFFQRVVDGYIFPIDAELQAHHLLRRKDFNQKYRYLGWSQGKHIAQMKNTPTTVVKYGEGANITDEGKEAIKNRAVLINEVMEKELSDAIDNPDKSFPRDFRSRDLSGNVSDSQMAGWLKMMR